MIDKDSDEKPLHLHSLQREAIPPVELEERIISDLRERQMIRQRRKKLITPYRLIAVAACVVFFVAGSYIFIPDPVDPIHNLPYLSSVIKLFLPPANTGNTKLVPNTNSIGVLAK